MNYKGKNMGGDCGFVNRFSSNFCSNCCTNLRIY